jgi:RNA polymerase sigma-70 factor (ECF subfamily)
MNEEMAWVVQAQHGSDEAFTQLVEAYQTCIYNLCYRMLGEPEAAEDAAQETFLQASQHLNRYDPLRPFATWLLSIAAHYCIDRRRHAKFSMISIDQEEEGRFQLRDAGASNPETETMHREQRGQIQGLLKCLDAVDRAAIVMRYWQDYSEAEIAQSLNLTASAVKSRLYRARRELAGVWQAGMTRPEHERRLHQSHVF